MAQQRENDSELRFFTVDECVQSVRFVQSVVAKRDIGEGEEGVGQYPCSYFVNDSIKMNDFDLSSTS